MKRRNKVLMVALAVLLMTSSVLVGCNKKEDTKTEEKNEVAETKDNGDKYKSEDNPVVTIEMESGDKINLELYPQVAPNTVNNFISLVNKGYYDGTIFHRVIPGFMIQGGDPDGTGMGGPGYGIKGEFNSNGVKNDITHVKGVLSMARTQDPNSGGSQFFIMVQDSPHLDNDYAAFGKVTEGIEVADEIVKVKTDGESPVEPQVMKKVTVDLKGKTYDEPEIIK